MKTFDIKALKFCINKLKRLYMDLKNKETKRINSDYEQWIDYIKTVSEIKK